MNSISFVGRLGRDAKMKQVGATPLLEMNVANNVGFGDRKSTNWFKCTLWGKQAESLEKFMLKGKMIAITGELTIRKYEKKDGGEGASVEVRVDRVEFAGEGKSSPEDEAPATKRVPNLAEAATETKEDMPF